MKKIILILAGVLAAGSAGAQVLEKQLEVTREYTPRVAQAAKLGVKPDLTDTVKLRPDVEYDIRSSAWKADYPVGKLSKATVDTWALRNSKVVYVKLGAGLPVGTTGDIYFTPRVGRRGELGIYGNHRARWADVKRDQGMAPETNNMVNRAGMWGKIVGNRREFYGEGRWERAAREFDMEGGEVESEQFGMTLRWGDKFEEVGKFNFRMRLDMEHTTRREANRKDADKQMDVDAGVEMAQMWESGEARTGFEMEARGRYYWDPETIVPPGGLPDTESVLALTATPRFVLRVRGMELKAGLDARLVGGGNEEGKDYVKLEPAVSLRYDAKKAIIPFLRYDTRVVDGTPAAMMALNPYIDGWEFAPLGWANDLRVGIEGNLKDRFTYRLAGGVTRLENYHVAVASASSFSRGWFEVATSDGRMATVGAQVGLHGMGRFSAEVEGNWNNWELDEELETGMPKWDGKAKVMWKSDDERIKAAVGARVMGERRFSNYGEGREVWVNKVGTVVNVFASAELKLLRWLSVWVEGENLAGQKLYPYNYYQGVGTSAMAGLKIVF